MKKKVKIHKLVINLFVIFLPSIIAFILLSLGEMAFIEYLMIVQTICIFSFFMVRVREACNKQILSSLKSSRSERIPKDAITCPYCDGQGYVLVTGELMRRGLVYKPCPMCGGKGYIMRNEAKREIMM